MYKDAVNRTVVEYTKLLSRAFNGAIEVDGTRIVAHPSGTLITRTPSIAPAAQPTVGQVAAQSVEADPDNDWTNV